MTQTRPLRLCFIVSAFTVVKVNFARNLRGIARKIVPTLPRQFHYVRHVNSILSFYVSRRENTTTRTSHFDEYFPPERKKNSIIFTLNQLNIIYVRFEVAIRWKNADKVCFETWLECYFNSIIDS
ncbi:hypothetical protein PUN28_000127 [Cardiocondyla obscurior]|uniref:Secreted protein n=1 Tax=Cardiocondyla obscurior TaxID=286306 RepID=A0AAW2GXX7_9HYME